MDSSTSSKLSLAIAKWVATACRPINVVEDEGLLEMIRIASQRQYIRVTIESYDRK